jgi:iron(II)-dependent oxidoreductase
MEVVGPTQTASFWQGSDKYSSQYGPCRPVTIAYPFSMLKYEVTRSEFRRCVENGPCTQPICSDTPGNPALDLVDEHYADHPVVCASRPMAATYCEWVGGRLPSESEWEYAAAGPNTGCHAGWWYPWSSSFVSGQYANYAEGYNPFQGAEPPDQNGGPTTPVGFFDGSLRSRAGAGWLGGPETFQTQDNSSPFGIFDLAGNVAEWAADGWHASFAPGAPQDGSAWLDETSPEGVKRGEGWPDSGKALTVFFRGPKSPTLALSFMGIRCVTDSPLGP